MIDFNELNAWLEPGKKEAYIELLHKKDMKNVKFCELDFGSAIIEKKVRDRAIAERIDLIKSSHSLKTKFEEQFKEVKRRKAEAIKREHNMREDFKKMNL